jgi:hypothetical protein
VESGYTNTVTTGTGGGITISYPQALVRLGVTQHLEFAITPPSHNSSSLGGSIVGGSTDMNFGAKWELGYNAKGVWGVNGVISAPTGDLAFTAGDAQYTGNVNWGYAFNSIWSATGTFSFNSLVALNAASQTQRYSAFIASIEFTAALPGTSQAFAEYAYFSHAAPGAGSKSIIDFGYQRDLGPHVQVDVEYGFQPTIVNGQKLHYIGAGLSFMN